MIEAAGITLRESIEAILVVFIMVAYLDKTGVSHKKKWVYSGALFAVGASIALAFVLSSLGINPENEIAEGILYFIAGILVLSLTIWMVQHARHFKSEIEKRMEKAGSKTALFGIAFLMVFREGVETVIFFQSLLLSGTNPVSGLLGGLTGVGLALLFGAVFLRGTTQINLGRFFRLTSIILFVLALELISNGFHEFFEVGLLPSNETLLLIIGFFAKSSTSAAIIGLLLLSIAGTVLYDLYNSPQPDLSHLSSSRQRKVRFNYLKTKYGKIGLISVITVAMVTILAPTFAGSDISVPEPTSVEAERGTLSVPIPSRNGLHKFNFKGKRFIVAVNNDQTKVALDQCYICPPTGYGYDGEKLICLNCGAPILPGTIGTPGGCNPRPLDFRIRKDTILVSARDIIKTWNN